MRFKLFLTGSLLTFVVISLGVAIADVAGLRSSGSTDEAVNPSAKGEQWVAFYFHSSHRCPTCQGIEANTKAAIGDLVAGQAIQMRVLNYEEPAHRHFVEKFELAFPTLILAQLRDGSIIRWKNLERIWELCDERPAFISYVQTEVANFREGRP